MTAVTYGEPGTFQRVFAVSMRSLRDLGEVTRCAVCGVQLRLSQRERNFSRDFLAGLIPVGAEQVYRSVPDGVNLCIVWQLCNECGHRNVYGESWPL